MAVNSYGQEMLNKYVNYKHRVNRALEEGKIFRVVGEWPRLRDELEARGWVEKKIFSPDNLTSDMPHSILLAEAQPGNDYEKALCARMMGRRKPDYLWLSSAKYYYRYLDIPIVNRMYLKNINCGSKDGIRQYFEMMEYGNHPRGYNLIEGISLDTFVEDYYLTAATSLVLFLDNHQSLADRFTFSDVAINWSTILLILDFVQFHLNNSQYGMEISTENSKNSGMDEAKGRVIYMAYECIVRQDKKIRAYYRNIQMHVPIIRGIARRVRETWPQRVHDGYNNIWLLKPNHAGQGNGIILTSDVKEVVKIVKEDVEKNYVIQKYIERPLLIYNTKFDIRSYFLITIHKNKIRGWAHGKCTIRIASKEFSFDNFSKATHITNTAVQRRIKSRSNENLPMHHMWTVRELGNYLRKLGKPHAWDEIIFPQIKRTLIALLKSLSPNIEHRPGRFEILGCDWLITEDMQVYMLEINRSPALYYYTEVSREVVGSVMDDLIKVTVDYMRDETASTGGFQLLQEINTNDLEPFEVDWSEFIKPKKVSTPTDDLTDYSFDTTRHTSAEPLPDDDIIPRPPSPPPLPLPEPDPNTQTTDNEKTATRPAVVTVETMSSTEEIEGWNKNVLKESTKGNVLIGTATVQRNSNCEENQNLDGKYIMPPTKRVRPTLTNNENNHIAVENV